MTCTCPVARYYVPDADAPAAPRKCAPAVDEWQAHLDAANRMLGLLDADEQSTPPQH